MTTTGATTTNETQFDELTALIGKAIDEGLNILLEGKHGVGKTSAILAATDPRGLKVKYFSGATMEPWSQFVGIPVPNTETKHAEFYRPADVMEADVIVIDEYNRAVEISRNAVMELIQFGSINGDKLPNLKCIIAAINPAGEGYAVDALDPAQVDRFHIHKKVEAQISEKYLTTKFGGAIAASLINWYNVDLSPQQRDQVSPRRVEYVGMLMKKGFDPKMAFADQALANMTVQLMARYKNRTNFTLDDVNADGKKYIDMIKGAGGEEVSQKILELLGESSVKIIGIMPVFTEIPDELVRGWARKLRPETRSQVIRVLESKFGAAEAKKQFPKIYRLFQP